MWAKRLNQSGSNRKYIFQMEWQVTTTLDAKIRHPNQKGQRIHTFYKIYSKKYNLFSELIETFHNIVFWAFINPPRTSLVTGPYRWSNNPEQQNPTLWLSVTENSFIGKCLFIQDIHNSSEAFHPLHHGGSPLIQILC